MIKREFDYEVNNMEEYTITIDIEIDDGAAEEKLISVINDMSKTLNATGCVHSIKARLMTTEFSLSSTIKKN